MVPKIDKDKSTALVLKLESNVASASLVSAIDLAHRFAPFSFDYTVLIPALLLPLMIRLLKNSELLVWLTISHLLT
jgi:hypothetical protein